MDLIALILVVNVWIVIVHSLGKMNKVILACSIFPPIYDIYMHESSDVIIQFLLSFNVTGLFFLFF
jgi:hypothetical protein